MLLAMAGLGDGVLAYGVFTAMSRGMYVFDRRGSPHHLRHRKDRCARATNETSSGRWPGVWGPV